MRKIRIGNDIKVIWKITVNEGTTKLSELEDTVLELRDFFGRRQRMDFTIEDESVVLVWRGTEQRRTGRYTLTFWANFGGEGQAVVDCCDFVELVSRSCHGGRGCPDMNVSEEVELSGELALGVQGKSAYRSWLDNGNEGSEKDFLEWLRIPSTEAAASAAYLSELGETDDVTI